jgi:hypothetical protein
MKSFVAGLVLLIAGAGAGAQEAPLALPEGSWPEPGRVTEMRVIHDLQGGVYIPYIAEGVFRVLHAGPGGKLAPYAPEGFEGGSPGARSIKAISDGPERYVAFIDRNGGESIRLFGFGFRTAMSCCPLAETEAGSITDYSLVSSKNGGLVVYTLAGGRLRSFSTGIRGDTPRLARDISGPGEQVEAFGVRRERDQETSYGWYRVARKDYWELALFSLNDGGSLVVERTVSRAHIPQVEYGVSLEGKAVFIITAGSAVSVCHAEGPRFVRDLNFEAPFTVRRYIPALLTEGPAGLLTLETEGTEILCGVSHEQSGAPALRDLFARPSAEILGLFFTEDRRISLLYRSGQTLGAALLRPDGGIIDDRPLPVSAEGAALFQHPLGRDHLYVLSCSGELSVLSTLEFEGETWRLAGETQIPRFFPEELHSIPGVMNDELILMVSPEALMLYETGSSGRQTVEMNSYARSFAHNGIVWLAAGSENGIALYRIGE